MKSATRCVVERADQHENPGGVLLRPSQQNAVMPAPQSLHGHLHPQVSLSLTAADPCAPGASSLPHEPHDPHRESHARLAMHGRSNRNGSRAGGALCHCRVASTAKHASRRAGTSNLILKAEWHSQHRSGGSSSAPGIPTRPQRLVHAVCCPREEPQSTTSSRRDTASSMPVWSEGITLLITESLVGSGDASLTLPRHRP